MAPFAEANHFCIAIYASYHAADKYLSKSKANNVASTQTSPLANIDGKYGECLAQIHRSIVQALLGCVSKAVENMLH